jgi:predicted  nucleic acid-binding Zn-ribbon protein
MAYTCIHCQVFFESIDSNVKFCPECGQPQLQDEHENWSSVARFGELAEAGYFGDELRSRGIRNRLVASSHLDLDGTWRSQFQLLVAEADRDSARDWLTQNIQEHDELQWNDNNEPEPLPQANKHLAGVLCIIGFSLSAGLLIGFQLSRPERTFVDFWDEIKSTPTFTTDPRLPGPARRMEVDKQRGVIRIWRDLDRDGVFDEQIEFRPAG